MNHGHQPNNKQLTVNCLQIWCILKIASMLEYLIIYL